MKCTKCGNELRIGTKYCTICGEQLSSGMNSSAGKESSIMHTKQDIVLKDSKIFGAGFDLYDSQYDGAQVPEGDIVEQTQYCLTVKNRELILLDKLAIVSNKLDLVNSEYEKERNRTYFGYKAIRILGVIIFIIGALCAVPGYGDIDLRLFIGIFIAGCGIALFPASSKVYAEPNQELRAQIRYDYEKMFDYLSQMFNLVDNRYESYINSEEMKACKALIPDEYWTVEAITAIATFIKNRRADSIKEAINLYEQQLHNERIEAMQYNQMVAAEQALEEQKKQTKVAAEQYKVAVDTNRAARAAAADIRRIRKKL